MNKLEEARLEINLVDSELIKLFKRRMRASREVALYKKENKLDILDSKREKEIIEKNIKLLNDDTLASYYLELFKALLKVSKDYQADLINGEDE